MATLDRGPCQRQAPQRPVSVGARPERPSELASDREAVKARDLLEDRSRRLLGCVRYQVVAHELDCPVVDGGSAVVRLATERQEAVGDRGRDLGRTELADRLVDVGE